MVRNVIFGGMLCAVVALAGYAGENKESTDKQTPKNAKAPVYKTPQECFDVAAKAEINGDHKTYVACLAPQSQKKLAAEQAIMSLGGIEAKGEEAEQMAKRMKPVTDALAKHGLSKEATKGIKVGTTPEERQKAEQALLALIKDPAEFLVDLANAFEEAIGLKGKKAKKAYTKTLTEVKIDGDKAIGIAITKTKFSEKKSPVSFVKNDNGWLMVLEPERKPEKKKKPKLSKDVSFRTTVAALTKEFRADATAANKKYEGKIIELEGFVHHANKYFLSSTIVLVGVKVPADRATSEVNFKVGPTDKSWWLGRGQKVKVVGRYVPGNRDFFGVELEDCGVTALEPNPTQQVAAKDLAKEFEKGEEAARKKYFGEAKSKEFIVEGIVAGVKKGEVDVTGKVPLLITLTGTDKLTIACQVREADFEAAKKGDTVKLKGVCPIGLFDEAEKRVLLETSFILPKE